MTKEEMAAALMQDFLSSPPAQEQLRRFLLFGTPMNAPESVAAYERGIQAVDLHGLGRICPFCNKNEAADGLVNCIPCMQGVPPKTAP